MRRLRDEGGVVAVMMALVVCFVMVPLAAFAVDIGMQRVLRRDMQSMADVVALNAARHLDGRTQAVIKATSEWRGDIHDSVADNLNLALGDGKAHTVDVTQQQEDAVATVSNSDLRVTVTMGMVDEDGNFTAPIPYPDVPNAVRVVASSTIGHTFTGGSGGASRTAVASANPSACFRIGTYALGLSTDDSVLNGLLGNALHIGVLGYKGLATSKISLLGLATELGAGTPQELVSLPNLTLGELIQASAEVLNQTRPGDANVELLNTIKSKLDLAGLSGQVIDLGKILDVGTGNGSGLDAGLNLLDLVSGAAFVANGDAAISVPGLNLSLPGVGSLKLKLKVTDPPKIACNDGVASTGQVELDLSGDLSVGVPLVLTAGGPIRVKIGLAEAEGRLADTGKCVNGSPQSISVAVTQQDLASTSLSLGDPYSTPPEWIGVKAVLGLVSIPLVNAGVSTTQPNPSGTYTLDPWQDYVDSPFHTPQIPNVLPKFSASVGLLGIPLGGLLSPLVSDVLNPIVGSLNSLISGTIAPALGLQLAGVDIFAVDDPPPTCSSPRLVG